ncbi:MAG: ABC transporter permease [Dysgonomonas sp.]|nr:ABC transporter permease [Dysgonomonas sp.]
MRILLSFIKKEFYHILRDPLTLLIMFVLPIILMSILSYAVSTEVRNIPFVVLDQSRSTDSKELIEKVNANAYFALKAYCNTAEEVENAFRKGQCTMAIVIPTDFGSAAVHSGVSDIQVMVDASDPNQASTMANYFQAEVMDYQQTRNKNTGTKASIVTEVKMLYNPQMLSTYSIVPGLKGMVLILICTLMTSIAVVREKEQGTMEILLVSPLKPKTIIFAKAIPYLVVSIVDVILILMLSNWVLAVPINGSVFLLMLLALIYIYLRH